MGYPKMAITRAFLFCLAVFQTIGLAAAQQNNSVINEPSVPVELKFSEPTGGGYYSIAGYYTSDFEVPISNSSIYDNSDTVWAKNGKETAGFARWLSEQVLFVVPLFYAEPGTRNGVEDIWTLWIEELGCVSTPQYCTKPNSNIFPEGLSLAALDGGAKIHTCQYDRKGGSGQKPDLNAGGWSSWIVPVLNFWAQPMPTLLAAENLKSFGGSETGLHPLLSIGPFVQECPASLGGALQLIAGQFAELVPLANISAPENPVAPESVVSEVPPLPPAMNHLNDDPAILTIWRHEATTIETPDMADATMRILFALSHHYKGCHGPDFVAIPIKITSTTTTRDGLGIVRGSETDTFDKVLKVRPEFAGMAQRLAPYFSDNIRNRRFVGVRDLISQDSCNGQRLQRLEAGIAKAAGVNLDTSVTLDGAGEEVGLDVETEDDRYWQGFTQNCVAYYLSAIPNMSPPRVIGICICSEQSISDLDDSDIYEKLSNNISEFSNLNGPIQEKIMARSVEICGPPDQRNMLPYIEDRYQAYINENP